MPGCARRALPAQAAQAGPAIWRCCGHTALPVDSHGGERVASPTCRVPHFPEAKCFPIRSNLAKGTLARLEDSGCQSRHCQRLSCQALSLCIRAASLDLKETDPPCMWHHRAPGGHRHPHGQSHECQGQGRAAQGGSSCSGTMSVCGAWRPRPRLLVHRAWDLPPRSSHPA